ncbi:hypothetical protein GCM10020331_061690 [Ectobacillus funiculus]
MECPSIFAQEKKNERKKFTRIVIEFKDSLKELYRSRNEQTEPNLLIIEINPNEKCFPAAQ